MAKYQFLSEGWITAARAIYDAHHGEAPAVPTTLRANLNVTDVPFGDDPLRAHLDTSAGELGLALGHLEVADVTLTLSYETAKAQLGDHDQTAVMPAVIGGPANIDG